MRRLVSGSSWQPSVRLQRTHNQYTAPQFSVDGLSLPALLPFERS
jgi:hypothetical protein